MQVGETLHHLSAVKISVIQVMKTLLTSNYLREPQERQKYYIELFRNNAPHDRVLMDNISC